MTISEYIEQFRLQYPQIRPFEEEDDVEWWNQGLDQIAAGKFDQAEETFKRLVLAQPESSDGFNGLGLVYEKKNDPVKAELFHREAISKAECMVHDGSMDIEMLNMIQSDLNRVLKKGK